MKIKFNRNNEEIEADSIIIQNGLDKFTIKKDVTGALRINKVDLSGDWNNVIIINPSSSNEILLS